MPFDIEGTLNTPTRIATKERHACSRFLDAYCATGLLQEKIMFIHKAFLFGKDMNVCNK